jgi:hypothetical protein
MKRDNVAFGTHATPSLWCTSKILEVLPASVGTYERRAKVRDGVAFGTKAA